MFITAKSYFVDYKLSESYTNQTSEYATNFLPYIGFASQIPNVLFNWLNIFVNLGWAFEEIDSNYAVVLTHILFNV